MNNTSRFNMTSEILTTTAQMFSNDHHVTVIDGDPCTDGQQVFLPGIRSDMSHAELEILRGYLIHEAAHIRYGSLTSTMKQALHAARSKWQGMGLDPSLVGMFYNAAEDARIEARAIWESPPAAGPIAAIRNAATRENNSRPPSENLAYQVSLAFLYWLEHRLDSVPNVPFGKSVIDGLDMTPFLDYRNGLKHGKWRAADALQVAIDFGEAVFAFLDSQGNPDPSTPDNGGNPDGPGGDVDGEQGDESNDESGDASSDQPGDTTPGDTTPASTEGVGSSTLRGPGSDDPDRLESTYGEQIEELEADLDKGESPVSVTSDSSYQHPIGMPRQLINGKTSDGCRKIGDKYPTIHASAMRLTNVMRRALNCDDRVHWSIPKESGHRIDTRRLAGVAGGLSTRAFNRRRVDVANRTQVSIAIDRSGSMSGEIAACTLGAYMIADACESLSIPTGIVSFACSSAVNKAPGARVHSETWWNNQACGGTTMAPALVQVAKWKQSMPTHRHVFFLFSDGETSEPSLCRNMLRSMSELGSTVVAVDVNGGMSPVLRSACDRVININWNDTAEQIASKIDAELRQSGQS